MLNFKNINSILPSNKKFGFFFTIVFLFIGIYFYIQKSYLFFYFTSFISLTFFLITILNPNTLKPLNLMWMRLGLVLGLFISPLVMGIIYFFIFTPISILMRLIGRDELNLQFKKKQSYWIKRATMDLNSSFKNQF